MTHQALRDALVDLALGLLPPGEAREVEAHVAGCPACGAELASLRHARADLAGLPPLPAPEHGEAVLIAAARQAAEAHAAARRRGLPRWFWATALGTASAAAAVLVTLQLSRSAPASRFDEGREALAGRGSTPPAVTPSRDRTQAEVAAPQPAAPGTRVLTMADRAPASAVPGTKASPEARAASEAKAVPGVKAVPEARAVPGNAGAPARAASETSGAERREEAGASRPGPAAAPPPLARVAAKATAPADAAAPSATATTQGSAARAELQSGPACPRERSRTLTRDGAGRVVRLERTGRLSGSTYAVDERYGEDGRLTGAVIRMGERELVLGAADLEAVGLEPVPGLRLAPTAVAAEAPPPPCGP